MKSHFILAVAFAATPGFAQESDPVFQMIDGITACILGAGKADTTLAELDFKDWTAEADAAAGVTKIMPPEGPTTVIVSNDVGFCQVDSSGLGTDDAETPFSLFMMGGNSGIEETATGTDAAGCMTKTLSNGAVAVLTSGGDAPTCESDTTSSWRFDFPAGG